MCHINNKITAILSIMKLSKTQNTKEGANLRLLQNGSFENTITYPMVFLDNEGWLNL